MSPRFLTTILIGCLALAAPSPTSAEDNWQAGLARVNITPQTPMWLSGYASRDKPATGKRHDLWAKALVLEDTRGKRAVFVTMDLVGISREITGEVCTRIERELQIPRSRIALATSHTHTGPMVAGNLTPLGPPEGPQQDLIQTYSNELIDHLVEVVRSAVDELRPVKLLHGASSASFAVNRRNNPESEVPARRAEGRLVGPVDHEVPVLVIRDSAGKLLAVVAGYACHATVLGDYQWSGDWPGVAQIEIERRHPGTMALFWAGCGADQNPLPRRSVELMNQYGRELADAVDRALAAELTPIAPVFGAAYREIDLPMDEAPTRAELESRASAQSYEGRWARMQLATLDRDGQLPTSYPYPVQVWRLGDDVTWVILGGEVVVDYAHLLKHDLDPTTWVTSYANDVMGYIPSRRVLAEGGYEGGGSRIAYGLPAPWNHRVEALITGEVEALAAEASQAAAPQPNQR